MKYGREGGRGICFHGFGWYPFPCICMLWIFLELGYSIVVRIMAISLYRRLSTSNLAL